VSNVRVIDNLLGSDHDAVEFALSVFSDNVVQSSRVLFNYSKSDLHKVQEVLSHDPWNCIPIDNGIEYTWQCWLFFSAAIYFSYSYFCNQTLERTPPSVIHSPTIDEFCTNLNMCYDHTCTQQSF